MDFQLLKLDWLYPQVIHIKRLIVEKMKNSFKPGSYFNIVCTLIVLTSLLWGCSKSSSNFTEFLYDLAEIDEQDRNSHLEDWLNKQEEFPVIDGTDVYFIYKQKKEISVFLTGDMNRWNHHNIPLLKIVGTDYYYTQQNYPLDSGLEYLFIAGNKSLLDPLNKRITKSEGQQASLLFMPEYDYPLETLLHRDQIYTPLDTLTLNDHELIFYQSPGTENSSSLIIFLNGKKYLEFAQANIILDNLVKDKRIPPCFAVFIPSAANLKNSLAFVRRKYNLSDNRIIIGGREDDGLGILFSLKENPQQTNGLFLQSALAKTDSLGFLSAINNVALIGNKVFIGSGYFEKQDSLYSELVQFLQSKEAKVDYMRYNEGASWTSWKGHLDDALIYLLRSEENPKL